MRRIFFVWMVIIGISFFFSCNTVGEQKETKNRLVQNTILQQKDGTISLKVDKAECYHDTVDPCSNTAEWNVVVSKSGRFNVWLSSATKDTTDLQYQNAVMLSILDDRLEAHPICDKIIQNSSDVAYPYFRADSFMGSLYIQDTGIYNIQVISDKIVPMDSKNEGYSVTVNTKLLSVFFTPITR
ncbi:MAG: hypothetical protein NTV31_12540 [Bacteroidia bacterium]|nr:hypothetical protein [Bacteroidia bacterium]